MKNYLKTFLGLAALLTALCAARPALAADIIVGARVDSTKSVAMNLKWVGGTATSTGAYVTISATVMTFYHPFGTVDTTIGTSGAVTYASTLGANTMGSLCDYINSRGTRHYQCTLLGAKRDDAPSMLLTRTATNGNYDLFGVAGSSVPFNLTAGTIRIGINPAGKRRVQLIQCVGNVNVIDTLSVYGKQLKAASGFNDDGTVANDTSLVYQAITADDTDKTIPQATVLMPFAEFAPGAHVVIAGGSSTNVQAAANFLQCQWKEIE